MIFNKIAVYRMKKRLENAISRERVSSVEMMEDQSIVVRTKAKAIEGKRPTADSLCDQYRPEDIANIAMLEITGPLKPGQIHFFNSNQREHSWEDIYTLEVLDNKLRLNDFYSAQLKNDGSVSLFIIKDYLDEPLEIPFSEKGHKDFILSKTGPLTPGQVFYFNKDEAPV